MARKLYDLTVAVGRYVNRLGEEKKKYKTIGVMMQGDEGAPFIILDKTFNLAAVPSDQNRDGVLVSLFEPRQHEHGGRRHSGQAQEPSYEHGADDRVPF